MLSLCESMPLPHVGDPGKTLVGVGGIDRAIVVRQGVNQGTLRTCPASAIVPCWAGSVSDE